MKTRGCGYWGLALLWWLQLAFAVAVTGAMAALFDSPSMAAGGLTVGAAGFLCTPIAVSAMARKMERYRAGE